MLSLITDKSRLAALSGKIKKGKCPDELYNKTLKFEKVENNVELVIDLEPDLVLIMDWMGKDKISQLEDAGMIPLCTKLQGHMRNNINFLENLQNL